MAVLPSDQLEAGLINNDNSLDEGVFRKNEQIRKTQAASAEPKPSVLDTVKSAFALENPLGAKLDKGTLNSPKDLVKGITARDFATGFGSIAPVGAKIYNNLFGPDIDLFPNPNKKEQILGDPTFNPIEQVAGTEYEKFADRFVGVQSPVALYRIQAQIDREIEHRKVLQNSGALGIVSMVAAGVIDPTVLIPAGSTFGVAKGTIKGLSAANKAITVGKTLVVGAGTGMVFGAAAVGIQEAALQDIQATREPELLTRSLIIGAVAGAILGPIAARGAKATTSAVFESVIRTGDEPIMKIGSTSVGAAEVLLDSTHAAAGLANLEFRFIQRVIDSVSKVIPGASKKLANLRARKGNVGISDAIARNIASPFEGLRSPNIRGQTSEFVTTKQFTAHMFESNLLTGQGKLGIAITPAETRVQEAFNEITKLGRTQYDSYRQYLTRSKAEKQSETFTELQFDELVGKALRRGDESDIVEVAKLAKTYRKAMDDVLKKLQDLDIISKDIKPKFAASYFTRSYNVEAIVQNRRAFNNLLKKHFVKGGLDNLDADAKAAETIEKILKRGDNQIQMSEISDRLASGKGAFTKERTLGIPDTELEPFLNSSANKVVSSYIFKARTQIGFKESLQSQGFDSIADVKKALGLEADKLSAKLPDQAARIEKSLRKEFKLVDDISSIVLGNIRKDKNSGTGRALSVFRKYTTMVRLGAVTISSLPDVGMPIFKFGVGDTVKDGWASIAKGIKAFNGTKEELIDMGVAAEIESNKVLKALADSNFEFDITESFIEKVSKKSLRFYAKSTGITYWNAFHKGIASNISQSRLLRALGRKNPSEKEVGMLSTFGIGRDMYERINTQFIKYGETIRGSRISHFGIWDDNEAAKVFSSGVRRDVESTIITPGLGDIPVFAQRSEWGATVLQFKSFSSAATNKLLLSGIQRRDINVAMGLVSLISLGYTSYAIKEKIRGREPSTDPDRIILEGISRSGLAGLFGDYILALAPGVNPSRYSQNTSIGSVFGPSTGSIKDWHAAMTGIYDVSSGKNDFSERETKQLLKLLPFQNLFYIRALLTRVFKDDKKKQRKK